MMHRELTELFALCHAKQVMLTTAESCTGGLLAGALTELAGSSALFDGGFVTYSNAAKTTLLGVDAALIEAHGAVSAAVACAMATGALARAPKASLALSTTGIAGPDGGSEAKPVGTVYIGWQQKGHPAQARRHHFTGDRASIREQTIQAALKITLTVIKS